MNTAQMIEILMVDDDEGDTLMTQEALEKAQFSNQFHIVHDGLQALDFMQKQGAFTDAPSPDLVLLDINMPRMNGHEVLAWMRTQQAYKITPVIILTTSSSEEDILKSYEQHANCFITKPVNMDQFNQFIKTINEFWTGIVSLPSKP